MACASSDDTSGTPRRDSKNQALVILHDIFPCAEVADLRYWIGLYINGEKEQCENIEAIKFLLEKSHMGQRFREIPQASGPVALVASDTFRTQQYAEAVEQRLRKEFKSLSRSTILGVMAENNDDYINTRLSLLKIRKKSWRYKISSWISRRQKQEDATTSLTDYAATGCGELDEEIWAAGAEERNKMVKADCEIAHHLNEKEYEAQGHLMECECCFGEYTFENMISCYYGHLICHDCITSASREGIYGQTTNLMMEKGSIRCLSSTAEPACIGHIPVEFMERVLPTDLLRALEQKNFENAITCSKLRITHCPFCPYVESDDIPRWRIRSSSLYIPLPLIVGLLGCVSMWSTALIFLVASLLWATFSIMTRQCNQLYPFRVKIQNTLQNHIHETIRLIYDKKKPQIFRCQNKQGGCGKPSCKHCGKEWKGIHKCFENEEDAMRLWVENAMAVAIKRTCPKCHTSFIKSDGCNKLTCVCGYTMCYVCRADLGALGYHHFCQHFRQIPGTECRECDKCDLYALEDENSTLLIAKRKAQAEWLEKNTSPENWNPWRAQIGDPATCVKTGNIHDVSLWWQKVQKILEWILEQVVEFESNFGEDIRHILD